MAMLSASTAFDTERVMVEYDCKVCQRHFETVLDLPKGFGMYIKPTICDTCAEEQEAREYQEAQRRAWRERSVKCGIPEGFLDYDKQKGHAELQEWVRGHWHTSLLITAPYSAGKSRLLAYCLTRWIINRPEGKYAFWNFSDLADKYAALSGQSLFDASAFKKELYGLDILVLDDLGKRRMTPVVEDLLYSMLDYFYACGGHRLIWITSNKPLSELARSFSSADIAEAVISRVRRMIDGGQMAHWREGK